MKTASREGENVKENREEEEEKRENHHQVTKHILCRWHQRRKQIIK